MILLSLDRLFTHKKQFQTNPDTKVNLLHCFQYMCLQLIIGNKYKINVENCTKYSTSFQDHKVSLMHDCTSASISIVTI